MMYREKQLINEFFRTLNERNGLNIAANLNISEKEAIEKLKRKYNIKTFKESYEVITGFDPKNPDSYYPSECTYYLNDKHIWFDINTHEYWNLEKQTITIKVPVEKWAKRSYIDSNGAADVDWETVKTGRYTDKTIEAFKPTTPCTDKNILDFIKSFRFINGYGPGTRQELRARDYKNKNAKEQSEENLASKLIKVDILDSDYKTAKYYNDHDEGVFYAADADSYYDNTYEDDEAFFTVKVTVGQGHNVAYKCAVGASPIYTWEDGTFGYSHLDDHVYFYEEDKKTKLDIISYADKLPNDRIRNLYIKYIKKIILDKISNYIESDPDNMSWD